MSGSKYVWIIVITVIVSIYTKQVACHSVLPASESQLKQLAVQVCKDLYFFKDKAKSKICSERFLQATKESTSAGAPLQIVCQSQQKVVFSITPSKETRLVILLPEDDKLWVNYKLLTDTRATSAIPIWQQSNYSLWTTTLDYDGTPSTWQKGPDVPPWHDDGAKDFDIRVEQPMFEYRNKTNDIGATFRISLDGAPNACTDVTITNICDKLGGGKFFKRTIKLENQALVIRGLPTDDECTLQEHRGKGRVKQRVTYRTPSCESLVGCMPPPEIAKDIYTEPIGTSNGSSWDVIVEWAPPRLQPHKYNVTLRADEVKNVILEGNVTEVTFEQVRGHGFYNVTIESIAANGQRVWTSQRAQFPATRSSLTLAMSGAWCGALLIVLTAGGSVIWRRRRRNSKLLRHSFFETSESMQPKEYSGEFDQTVGDSWEVRPERLLVHEVVGEGAFGVVRRGTLLPDGKDVAIKMLKEFPTVEEVRAFRKETELMKGVGAHPHLVSLVGCCTGRRPLIVVEYCARGDLLSFLRCSWDIMVSKRNVKYYNNINNNNNIENDNYRNDLFSCKAQVDDLVVNKMYDVHTVCDKELTSSDLLSFCRQIAKGMEFLASNRVVHRDLAARNILVTGDRTLKIADFGLSRDVYQENQYKQKGNGKMPVKWMALESLTHRIYTTMTDVWSFGVVMWEVATVGGAPYADVATARLPRLLRAGYRMPKPNNCSKHLYELMLSCWRARPKERPTFTELHQQLDELLNSACAEDYLSLEVDGDDAPATPRPQRYLKMLFRGHRMWAWAENYEQPWKAPQANHYTTPPAFIKSIAV